MAKKPLKTHKNGHISVRDFQGVRAKFKLLNSARIHIFSKKIAPVTQLNYSDKNEAGFLIAKNF